MYTAAMAGLDGPLLVKLFINANLKRFASLDPLLRTWEDTYYRRQVAGHDPRRAIGLDNLYFKFMHAILAEPVDLRVENGFVYFLAGNNMVRTASTTDENATFLKKWFLMFAVQTEIDGKHDYSQCLYNPVAAQCFPRLEICARYMCLSIRQASSSTRPPGAAVDFDCSASLSVWSAFNSAAIRLLTTPSTSFYGRKLLYILHYRHMDIYSGWNPDIDVYPGGGAPPPTPLAPMKNKEK